MDRIQILSIILSTAVLVIILELVRRRRPMERYALLWLLAGFVLLLLSLWKGALEPIAKTMGIIYPPNAPFVIAVGFILLLLLHFSLVISRLADQAKVLAQRFALLQKHLTEVENANDKSEHKIDWGPECPPLEMNILLGSAAVQVWAWHL